MHSGATGLVCQLLSRYSKGVPPGGSVCGKPMLQGPRPLYGDTSAAVPFSILTYRRVIYRCYIGVGGMNCSWQLRLPSILRSCLVFIHDFTIDPTAKVHQTSRRPSVASPCGISSPTVFISEALHPLVEWCLLDRSMS